LAIDSAVSAWISFTASALRCARSRTSAATTAKPRPWSPARAASTAAFSARMFVWKAIPFTASRISPTRRALASILSIVPATCCMRSEACDATSRDWPASSFARRQFSALRRALAASSSMPLAVSSREAACSCVRCVSCALPSTRLPEPATTASALERTCVTISVRVVLIFRTDSYSRPSSPPRLSAARAPLSSSPPARRSVRRTIWARSVERKTRSATSEYRASRESAPTSR
jgi:hypothetical protein